MKGCILLMIVVFGATVTPPQKRGIGRRSASLVGEYRDVSESGSLTFNVEIDKQTRKYRLWIGNMGTSSMNYHDADATGLHIDDSNGALAFSYINDDGQCSFTGTVKGRKITGQLACVQNGRKESEWVVLKKFR